MSEDAVAKDKRVVLTLDAGGTNLVFSAMRGAKPVLRPLTLESKAQGRREECLGQIIKGFRAAREKLGRAPAAISFAFPGPADYSAGVIENPPNVPAFRDGVPLGPILEEEFGLPVFINNDGDLFAYGEAIAGFLPAVNLALAKAKSPKRYQNLFGLTLGTGLGGGIVAGRRLLRGDNSAAGEAWLLRHKLDPGLHAEEGCSIRAVRRVYAEEAGLDFADAPEPKIIRDVALGQAPGHRAAAKEAWRRLGEVAGDVVAQALTLVDGLAVVGGGLSGAAELFMPALVKAANAGFSAPGGASCRLVARLFNFEDASERRAFLKGAAREISVPGSKRVVRHDPLARAAVGVSRLGASRAAAVGAYAFALARLDEAASGKRAGF